MSMLKEIISYKNSLNWQGKILKTEVISKNKHFYVFSIT